MSPEILFSPLFENRLTEILTIFFCGLIFGSFASALTYRVPRGLPWITKGKSQHGLRSACPNCKTLLTPRDLIPIISWVLSKGRCRHCANKIPKTYPVCEALTLFGCAGIYMVFGLTWFSLPFIIMVPFLIALMMIDFEHMILPNQLVAVLFLLGLIVLALKISVTQTFELQHLLISYIGGAIAFGALSWLLGFVMEKILKKPALGFGDVKFFTASGIWLGVPVLGYFCILAGMLGIALSIIWKKLTGKEVFPFGPALILSFYTILLLQGSQFL